MEFYVKKPPAGTLPNDLFQRKSFIASLANQVVHINKAVINPLTLAPSPFPSSISGGERDGVRGSRMVVKKINAFVLVLFLPPAFGFYNGVSTELVPQGSQELL